MSDSSELRDIDDQLLKLLNRRADLCRNLADKSSDNSGRNDQQIANLLGNESTELQRISKGGQGPLDASSLYRIFREVFAHTRPFASPVSVAYLGPVGTYTHSAALKHFGGNTDTRPYTTIDEVFRAVESGECQFGVAPVENSIEGTINRTLDCITESALRVCGEVRLRIEHNLLSRAVDTGAIKSVHAHPQALAQCRYWLDKHLPGVPRESSSSNAAAAQLAVENSEVAAIAGKIASEIYELPVLNNNIEDESSNTTRFMVIGREQLPPTGNDATCLLVSAPHKPGGLRKMLEPFDEAGVSMTRIESRPARKALWNYVFFIDVSGHEEDSDLARALEALSHETQYFRVLGSFPQVLE